MKNLVIVAVLALVALLARNRLAISDQGVLDYVLKFEELTFMDAQAACDRLSDDLVVDISVRSPQGLQEIQGGKKEFCEALKAEQAMMKALRTPRETNFENIEVKRGSFPWLRADATYDSTTKLTLPIGTIIQEASEELSVVQTWGGLKITRVAGEAQQVLK